MTQMQGIISILDNPEKTTRAASLRRTLSADTSSKRWLTDNGMPVTPTMKKIASSEHIAIESDEDCEMTTKGDQNPSRIDIWTAIMSQKKEDNSSMKLPPPYVHPLVKKSSSSLSEKSLKVCTESLGSETGSDVFSSHSSSDTASDTSSDDQKQENKQESDEPKVVKVACLTTKKSQQARSFPPPLPSLAAAHTDGPSLHMHSRRVEGRLVLEAVTVPPQKYFEAQRQDGRFLLSLINNPKQQQTLENNFVDVFNVSEEENRLTNNNTDEEEDENENEYKHEYEYEDEIKTKYNDKDDGIFQERPLNPTTVVMNVHKSTIVIKKITERDNENPLWSGKQLNAKLTNNAKLEELVEEEDLAPFTKSLPLRTRATGRPPLPPSPTANSVNAYQYFWRAKPTVASVIDPTITQHRPPTKTKDLVLLRGNKADCLLPSLKGCKEPRRSLLMWEPFCIAT